MEEMIREKKKTGKPKKKMKNVSYEIPSDSQKCDKKEMKAAESNVQKVANDDSTTISPIEDKISVDEAVTENASECSIEKCSLSLEKDNCTFEGLNKELNLMEPFLQPNNQLKNLTLSEISEAANSIIVDANKIDLTATAPPMLETSEKCFDNVFAMTTDDIQFNEEGVVCDVVIPFTEQQLLSLYNNQQLFNRQLLVTKFLEYDSKTNEHEFYEIVLAYLHARVNLMGHQKELQSLQTDYSDQKNKTWTFEDQVVCEEGTCDDDQLLTIECQHQIASHHPNITDHISKLLKNIRETVYDNHSLYLYAAELSKMKVENYLQNAIACPYFSEIPRNSELHCCLMNQIKKYEKEIFHIRNCISVLFSFCRRNVHDKYFVRDIKTWLADLIAILLKVASTDDHLFIFNHLLRCPYGVGDWAAPFIQVAPPRLVENQDIFGSLLLDHSIVVLSLLLEPVQERKKYLEHFKSDKISDEESEFNDTVWIVVDSSGDEEETVSEFWHLFTENDIIQFLNQIPFEAIFKHILLVEENDKGELLYNAQKASQHSMMKLYAFATCLLNVFSKGLATYSKTRYKNVVRRITRLIRHVVHYITDNMSEFMKHQKQVLKTEDLALVQRLLVEYDEFFERAIKTVFESPRSGAWQFLAVIPYSFVSLERLWQIAYNLHIGYISDEREKHDKTTDYSTLIMLPDTRGRFQDFLLRLNETDVYYLLTALANMASQRPKEEVNFIQVMVSSLFHASFLNEDTRETLSRTGRDLFLSIIESHSFVVSLLLSLIQENLQSIGSFSLYLLKYLSLDCWIPSEDDLHCLSYWLLYSPITSLENKLSRVVIEKLNWGFDPNGRCLHLDKKIHQRIALFVTEASLKVTFTLNQGNIISEGVKHVTSVVYSSSPEETFFKWCWSILNRLHLHQLDQPELEVRHLLMNQSLLLKGVPDPSSSPSLEFLKRGLDVKNAIAIFLALSMSSWGHSIPEFCRRGPECLEVLVSGGFCKAAMTILSVVTPLYFHQVEELSSDASFISILQKILSGGQTYISMAKNLIVSDGNDIPLLFSSFILDQINNYSKFNLSNSESIISFWINLLTSISDWRHSKDVLKIIDAICQNSFYDAMKLQVVMNCFSEQKKDLQHDPRATAGLGYLFTWVRSSPAAPPSLVASTAAPDVPWFSLTVLLLECKEEKASGLWRALLRWLFDDPQLTVDGALKKACQELNIECFHSNYLCIYRLGEQLLGLECNHPAFAATLQAFLTLYLTRIPSDTGNCDSCNLIHKFFEGYINGNFLKKIITQVSNAVTFWSNLLADLKKDMAENMEEETVNSQQLGFLQSFTPTISAMKGWLQESRIYETGLYLPALPPYLKPDKLLLLFQENQEIWPEILDREYFKKENDKYLTLWKNHRNSGFCSSSSPLPSPRGCVNNCLAISAKEKTSSASILKRLKEYDPPQPPPALPVFPAKNLLTENTDQKSIFYDVDRYMGLLSDYSRTTFVRSKELCALDCVFIEQLPHLWLNQEKKNVFTAKCTPPKKSKISECSGPASIVVKYNEKKLNEAVNARLEQNREQYESVLSQSISSPPVQLCHGAIHVEALANRVVSWYNNSEVVDDSLIKYGRKLFYHVIQRTTEETNAYPPAKQLITSCADILGQAFIHGHEDCQEELVEQVLKWDSSMAGLLASHFTPLVTSPDVFLRLYTSLGPFASSKPDITFMLLSKFNIDKWLKMPSVGCNSQKELIEIIYKAFSSLLVEDKKSSLTCLQIYRVHLMMVFKHDFSTHFQIILHFLLEISFNCSVDTGCVAEDLWYDFLNILSKGIATFSIDLPASQVVQHLRNYVHQQSLFSPNLVNDVAGDISSYFLRKRVEYGYYGIYPKFQPHIKPILTLVGIISFCRLSSGTRSLNNYRNDETIKEVWESLECLWAAWISPLGGKIKDTCPRWIKDLTMDRPLLLPWTPSLMTGPSFAVAIFASAVEFLHEIFPDCRVLPTFIQYYNRTFALTGVQSYILNVIHNQMASLPWHRLAPTMKEIEIFSRIVNEYLPDCHSFIGNIFIQIPWDKIVRNFSETDASKTTDASSEFVRLHVLLLGILVRISMEPSVRQSGLLHSLLTASEAFSWHLLDSKKFEDILNWFVMGCDPRVVLNMESRSPVDVALIHLLHVASGLMVPVQKSHSEAPLKRRLLSRALIRLFITSAKRHKALLKAQPGLFQETFAIMLTRMEDVVAELPPDDQYDEGFVLSCEAVAAIGSGGSPPPLQEACRDALLHWMAGHHPTRSFLLGLMTALSKGVLQLHYRSFLLEAVLVAIYRQAASCDITRSITWSEIIALMFFPLTNPLPMMSFAAQENHLLLLYAHTRWRLQIRTTTIEDEEIILSNLLEILPSINPDESCEKGLLLILFQILQLIKLQIERKDNFLIPWKQTRLLANLLCLWGEDRSSLGLLAAIGLGRKSPLSVSVRMICKSLNSFLLNQLVSPGSFSIINEQLSSDVDSGDESCTESLKALRHLISCRSNAIYGEVKEALEYAITFNQDCCQSILDSPSFLCNLVGRLFPKDKLLTPLTLGSLPEYAAVEGAQEAAGPTAPSASPVQDDFDL